MRRWLRLLVVLLVPPRAAAAQAPDHAITYLGNMGVLLEAGSRRIVIDGLHHGELEEYAAVPAPLLAALEAAHPPFAALTAALTTHRHRDHFHPGSVLARLRADSTMLYGAAGETVDSLASQAGALPWPGRVRALRDPAVRELQLAEGIWALSLPHNPTPSRRVANVGFLVDLGGLRVLHVGDADPTPATYLPHHLAARRIDVAIVPFWYLTSADDTVRRLIGARQWVATHVPPADRDSIRVRVARQVPGAVVLAEPGESHHFQ